MQKRKRKKKNDERFLLHRMLNDERIWRRPTMNLNVLCTLYTLFFFVTIWCSWKCLTNQTTPNHIIWMVFIGLALASNVLTWIHQQNNWNSQISERNTFLWFHRMSFYGINRRHWIHLNCIESFWCRSIC